MNRRDAIQAGAAALVGCLAPAGLAASPAASTLDRADGRAPLEWSWHTVRGDTLTRYATVHTDDWWTALLWGAPTLLSLDGQWWALTYAYCSCGGPPGGPTRVVATYRWPAHARVPSALVS